MRHSMIKTTATLFLLVALSFLGFSNAFALDGTWLNKDQNTRGITKVIISANSTTFHAFGKCHPKDCDWKKTRMSRSGNGYIALYDQGFAKRRLSIAKAGQELCVIVQTKYTDSRKPRRDTYYFKQKQSNCGFTGMVANKANYSEKITGAVIKFASENGRVNKTVRSDANGRYKVELPAGRYKVTSRARGYQPYTTGNGFFVVTCKGIQTGNIFMNKQAKTPTPKEDCVSFNHATAKVAFIGGRYKIVDGNHYVFDFGNKKDEAYKALRIIKFYKINSSCFVGRPDPSFEYLRVNGKAPQGKYSNEDCVSFNPRNLTIKAKGTQFILMDGNHALKAFPNRKEARQAKRIIQKYGFTKSCFVGRPGPSLEYMRK